MFCIETKNLSYKFSGNNSDHVLRNINLQVPYGSIFGFLGHNGAGKTTTLRLLLGLLKKQEGSVEIFGKHLETSRVEIVKNIGALIEAPSLYAHLTAEENLIVLQKVYRCPASRITKVLELVGLSAAKDKRVSLFSLGMKQRLSIAAALLHNPTLLILDEPTNGLDPTGIIEVRELLKKINAEFKTTILISSHLLSEVEKLVSHICILNKGKILFQGKLAELQQMQHQSSYIYFDTSNCGKTFEILSRNNLSPKIEKEYVLIPKAEREIIASVNQQLVENNIAVYQMVEIKNDLESIFIDLTTN